MSDREHCVHIEGYCVAGELRQLRFNAERDRALIGRLQAERNRLVEATELGKLSEEMEADNWGSGATLVRSAMHEIERLRTALQRVCQHPTTYDTLPASCCTCGKQIASSSPNA